jgi:Cu(I)/Ag(I) efflux system membrane fusion protein
VPVKRSLVGLVFSLFLSECALAQSHEEHDMDMASDMQPSKSAFLAAPIYICPMHTHIVKDHPGTCPVCGMDLVARNKKPQTNINVTVSGAMQQAMALTTEPVKYGQLRPYFRSYGSVQFDENRLSHIHTRASGWIEKLTVKTEGDSVKKGDLLYEIYSPDLLVAQEDFLSLLATNPNREVLLERGRRRLQLLGFIPELIKQLEEQKDVFYQVPYYAPHDGIVSELNIREGMYSEPQDSLITIADLSKVWVLAEVFQHQVEQLEVGRFAEVTVPALNDNPLTGSVEFIYPTLNSTTQTVTVRLSLDNSEYKLKPDMFAQVLIYAAPTEGLNIPTNALIQTAKHNRVFVQLDDGTFERRDIEIGFQAGNRVQILRGLEQGERIVTSGQFLLDAEASLSNVATDNVDGADNAHQHHH